MTIRNSGGSSACLYSPVPDGHSHSQPHVGTGDQNIKVPCFCSNFTHCTISPAQRSFLREWTSLKLKDHSVIVNFPEDTFQSRWSLRDEGPHARDRGAELLHSNFKSFLMHLLCKNLQGRGRVKICFSGTCVCTCFLIALVHKEDFSMDSVCKGHFNTSSANNDT